MKALQWLGSGSVAVNEVAEPKILNSGDAIIKVSSTAICGSDLHIYNGYIPSMEKGDILGHEFMGEVVEVGGEVSKLAVGDRVVVPFPISCGKCYYCQHDLWSLCDNSNPNAGVTDKLFGYTPAAIFGYSHLFGGYPGGQADYVRVPFADVGPFKVPASLSDEQVLFLTDIFPTGYMAAENCDIQPGQVIAVLGCGPVGQFAIRSALLLGAERVIAVDRYPERLALAAKGGAEVFNYEEKPIHETLRDMTGGRGPDAIIDAVGLEAHGGTAVDALYDTAMQKVRLETDRPYAIRQAIIACRKGGIVSLAGAYGGLVDKIPMGAAFNKGLTFRMGQTHVHRYLSTLLGLIEQGRIAPEEIITHTLPLSEAAHGYEIFKHKQEQCIKVVLKPGQ